MTYSLSQDPFVYFRGRVGLYALLKALNVTSNDKVAIQAFTCLAVPEAIMALGAQPSYIDTEQNGFNMAPEDLQNKITDHTQAIVVQHTFGIPANMDAIQNIASYYDLPVIEDCCHTFMTKYKGNLVGSLGLGAFYSFEWGKPVVAGVGGGIEINDENIREKVKEDYLSYQQPGFVTQGKIELQYQAFRLLYRPSLYWPVRTLFHKLGDLGLAESNYNPVGKNNISKDFQLKMTKGVKHRLEKYLKSVEKISAHSRWASDQYQQNIVSRLVSLPNVSEDCDTVFARYPLLAKNKQDLLAKAKKAGVELAEWYATPVHPLSGQELPLVHYTEGSCPNAEKLCKEVVSLPVHLRVRQKDIDRAIAFLNGV
ncbi:DegT/DnrJ/EryC1/StrS family aminotransferase [Desulfovermiculus halophilus]|uniref:DegT/DnrJ/EryC1/StrS family aminotransferase n=1 Tax=Desulfovermiculus halophilus TaxID=339722 RepID=UPI000AF575A9|nr:DegT/DnrJ/EryC1/StrS family aminotransferase [Desulfovermiculus halophilus]